MADLKELVKKNKKRALAFAITAAFSVGIATTLAGCENYNDEEEEEEEENNSGTTSSSSHGRSYWHSFSGSS